MTKDNIGLVLVHGLVYIPKKLRKEVIRRHHDILTHRYIRVEKTIEHISRNYYIPNIYRKVRQYIKQCDTCQRNKPSRHAPYGELQNSEVPTRPQEQITIDFITKLPKSDRYDMIIVVVDKLTKYAYIIVITKTIDTNRMANILLRYVFVNHGALRKITLDRDKLFILNIQ